MYSSLLKITTFYKDFLSDYYHRNPDIKDKGFDSQFRHLMDQGYGYSDYFPHYLESNYAIRSTEIIANASHLQEAWARENACKERGEELLLKQIIKFQPEVLFIQAATQYSADFIRQIKEKVLSLRLLIGHSCSPYTKANQESFREYDLLLTCSDRFKNELEKLGILCYLFPHAVESTLVKHLTSNTPKTDDIVFIGSLLYRSEFHKERIKVLEEMMNEGLPVVLIGELEEEPWTVLKVKQILYLMIKSGEKLRLGGMAKNEIFRKVAQLKEMPVKAPYPDIIRKGLRKEHFYGKRLLDELANHRIGFNIHAEVAGDYAANVRMFEVAGAGALLLTDHKKNIRELFEPGEEILTYKNTADLIEKAKWALENPRECEKISARGQARVLRDHSVEKRVDLLYEILKSEFGKRA